MPLGQSLAATQFLDGMFIASSTAPVPTSFLPGAVGAWSSLAADMAWMGTTAVVAGAVGLVLLCSAAWVLNLIALPGNWIAVALLAFYAWLGPADGRAGIGWAAVAAAFIVAVVGEIIEFFAGALGARKAGASRRSAAFSLLGSVFGAILGALLGLPVPVVGQVLAAILFGGLGATAGAIYGEWTSGRPWKESWAIGQSAFWGRTFGTLGKSLVGLVIVLIALGGVLL